MPAKKEETQPEEPSFELAMEKLEKIVAEMESDTLPLEQLLVYYEEGLKLVKLCGDKLEAAEKKIELITRAATGQPRAVDFPEPGGDTAPSTPPQSSATEKGSPGTKAADVRLF